MIRTVAIALAPLALFASPAMAAPKEAPSLPPELSDSAMADKLGKMAGALTRALMDMPVGELPVPSAEPEITSQISRMFPEVAGLKL